MNSCGLECGSSNQNTVYSYECSFCLKQMKDIKKLNICKVRNCLLYNLCCDCYSVHLEAHYAREYPVSQLINNMINLPLNKFKTIGNNIY